MKKFIISLVLVLSCVCSMGQDNTNASVETSTTSGRFEFIQSAIARRCSFLLDKYTGKVWQLCEGRDERLSFERVDVEGVTGIINEGKIEYQIYMGGTAVRDCFLLNISDGRVWVLVKTSSEEFKFERVVY